MDEREQELLDDPAYRAWVAEQDAKFINEWLADDRLVEMQEAA